VPILKSFLVAAAGSDQKQPQPGSKNVPAAMPDFSEAGKTIGHDAEMILLPGQETPLSYYRRSEPCETARGEAP
jgi:hypothetical protein